MRKFLLLTLSWCGFAALAVVRDVVPTAEGTVSFVLDDERAGINSLAGARLNAAARYTTKEISADAEISVSVINAQVGATNDRAVVTLPADAVVSYDAALKVPTAFVCPGAVTLTNGGQQPDLSLIQIVPYETKVAPFLVAGQTVSVAVKTDAATSCGGTVTLTIPDGALDPGTYAEEQFAYRIVFDGQAEPVPGVKETDGSVIFALPVDTYVARHVYRGQVLLDYGDGTVALADVTVHEGVPTFVWTETPVVIKAASIVTDIDGCTLKPVCSDPDYVATCDSVYTVTIAAAEAVCAEGDEPLDGTEQGGVRIAQTASGLKLQVVQKGAWTDFADAALDTSYTVTVAFRYPKGADDPKGPATVTYTLGKTSVKEVSLSDRRQVTEIFVSEGTRLPRDLTGIFECDKAVVVDVELLPGDSGAEISASSAEEAERTLKVGISEAVAAVLTDEEARRAYRAYFRIVAVPLTDAPGRYRATAEFVDGVRNEVEESLGKALAGVVAAFNTGSDVQFSAKPGLYYGVRSGERPDDMNVSADLVLAAGETVTVRIEKPEQAKGRFFRLVCSPTPVAR